MKVCLKQKTDKVDNLSLNKNYIVYSVETSVNGEGFYRIENDCNQIIPYPTVSFKIISAHVSTDWILWNKPNGSSALLPKKFAYLSFWEDYYNDDVEALNIFNSVKEMLIQQELGEDEISEVFEAGVDNDINYILNILLKLKDLRFLRQVLKYAKLEFESNNSELDTIVLAFQYLSLFSKKEVEEFFIYYLTNIELGCNELTQIVTDYFKK